MYGNNDDNGKELQKTKRKCRKSLVFHHLLNGKCVRFTHFSNGHFSNYSACYVDQWVEGIGNSPGYFPLQGVSNWRSNGQLDKEPLNAIGEMCQLIHDARHEKTDVKVFESFDFIDHIL